MTNAAVEAAFAATSRRIASPAWADDLFSRPPPVGMALDALAERAGPDLWSPLRHHLLAQLRQIEPRHKLAVLTMARNEAPDLAEWIAHHLAIGVEKIFVYTNDNDDGTDELLRWFAANAPVVPIPVSSARGVNVQHKNYNHALFLLPELRLYEWVAVLDADEFLLPDARFGHNLRNLLAAAPADTETILFPWHWRLWPRDFARTPGLLAERFGHAQGHDHIKFVTKLRHVLSLEEVHFPIMDKAVTLRDSEFRAVDQASGWHKRIRPATGGWVEHFWGRSFEEFLIKKWRGETMAARDGQFIRDYENYFQWTDEATPQNAAPWPAAMLAATKAKLAQFAARPGYTALREMIEARYAAHAARVRADEGLRALYDEMIARFVK